MLNKMIAPLLLVLLLIGGTSALADDLGSAKVTASIEGYDRQLAKGSVRAYTFGDALIALADENGINIVFGHDGNRTYVYSVNAITENRFGRQDGWFGYIIRKGDVIKPEDYLALSLADGDEVVLYYGSPNDTKIVSSLELAADGNNISFEAKTVTRKWALMDGKWKSVDINEGIKDLKIRIRQPDCYTKILKTNESGVAGTVFTEPGVYEYFAEGYVNGSYPAIVRTNDYMYLHGIVDKARVTRGEAAAFIINTFNVQEGSVETAFSDVDSSTIYAREIMCGASAGLFHGFENGVFLPSEPVTLAELAVMISGLLQPLSGTSAVAEVPAWASERAGAVVSSGLFDGVSGDWNGPVTADMLTRVYANGK